MQSRNLLTGPFCSPSIYMFKVLCLVLIGLLGRAVAQEIVGRNATAGKLVLEVP